MSVVADKISGVLSDRAEIPCTVCGRPTRSKYGACAKTPECRREQRRAYDADYRAAHQEDKKEQNAAYYEANRPTLLARKAARIKADPDYARKKKAWKTGDPEVSRERRRLWLLREDLPCRYAKHGCPNLKARNSPFCRKHRNAADRRRIKRRNERRMRRHAEAQGWACTWCGLPLPDSLKDAHQDHIIPQAVTLASLGRVIDDDWNMDVLHAACNLIKGGSLTPRAVTLAAEHGIDLGSARDVAA